MSRADSSDKSQPEDERSVIATMKQIADEYGLWLEVKECYDQNRQAGDPPNMAAWHALYEWDL